MYNIIQYLFVDIEKTIGTNLTALEARPYFGYNEGIKGKQIGQTITCLSETMNYEKIDIKVEGVMQLPFELNGTPVPVAFDGLQGKLWKDWKENGEVKLSITAKGIRKLTTEKHVKIGGEKE